MLKNYFLPLLSIVFILNSCSSDEDITTVISDLVPGSADTLAPIEKKIVGWGDSMLAGAGGQKSIVQVAGEVSGIPFKNYSVGGLTSNKIALLQGGIPFLVSVENNTLPGNGMIEVLYDGVEPLNDQTLNTRYGTINNVHGKLIRVPNLSIPTEALHYYFDRTDSANVTPINHPSHFKFDDAEEAKDAITIIWSGRNDNKLGPDNFNTRNNIIAMVNNMTEYSKKHYLVLSICNGNYFNEGLGTPYYGQIENLNTLLRETFGEYYVDIRKYMVEQAIYDAGIVPTIEDLLNMSHDCIPKSLMYEDNTHFNTQGYNIAGLYVARIIREKGWVD